MMSSPVVQISLAVSAGAATAVALMTLFAGNPSQFWTASAAANTIRIAPAQSVKLSGALPTHSEIAAAAQLVPSAVNDAPVHTSSVKVPALFAASGILFLIAGALRFFKPQGDEYAMLAVSSAQAERLRRLQEEERLVQERRLRLAREEAARRAGVQISSTPAPTAASTTPVYPSSSSLESEWKLRQQERERREREKAEAKQREIQERLARLGKLSSGSYQAVPAAPVAAPTVSEWERRQQDREWREKQLAEAKQREIQERLARLAKLTGQAVPAAPVAAPVARTSPVAVRPASVAPVAGSNEWEVRQQQRERMEREKQERAQREIQERLARLAKLGSTPQVQPVVQASASGHSELERLRIQREQRERREREAAEAKKREIQERLHRLQRLSAQSAAAPTYASKY